MISKGWLFLIVGNSGSGKDSLIKKALEHWPKDQKSIRTPQRYITRPPHETESFISLTKDAFHQLDLQNKFWITWHIYDLDYGIPQEIGSWLDQGDHVLLNVSRQIIPEVRKKYPQVKVIFISVPFEIIQSRLTSRGRETINDPVFHERLERARTLQEQPDADLIIDNSGDLTLGAAKLRDYLLSFF